MNGTIPSAGTPAGRRWLAVADGTGRVPPHKALTIWLAAGVGREALCVINNVTKPKVAGKPTAFIRPQAAIEVPALAGRVAADDGRCPGRT